MGFVKSLSPPPRPSHQMVTSLSLYCAQQLQKLKAENEKLKAENRALTRVVSKLTANAALASTSSSYSPSATSSSSYIGGK